MSQLFPTSLDPEGPLRVGRLRFSLVAAVFAFAFMALGAASVQLAVLGERGETAGPRTTTSGASSDARLRGDIVDRNGELLASTLTSYSLFADPTRVWDAEATAIAIAGVLPDIDVAEITARLEGDPEGRRRFAWIKRGLSPRQRQAVFELGLPGLDFEEEPRRIYPRGRLAAHVLGWTNIDGVAMAGAERAFDEELSRGDGRPVALSLDLRVQFALDDELRAARETFAAQAAVGLVTDVRTGEILALASLPDFDPNHPGDADAGARRNRAMASVYELGSIFKTFTLAMALDTNTAEADTLLPTARPLEVAGELIHDAAPAGRDLTVAEAFIRSSNVGMGTLALALGGEAQQDYLWRFGLNSRAPIEYGESAEPLTPLEWDDTARATVGFGHGVAVSPVAFAAAFGAAVNGGEYMRPTLQPTGLRGAIGDRVISEETSAEVARLLRAAVLEGTGRRADAPGLGLGGKTGTAEVAVDGVYDPDRVVSSFAAVFPYDDPQYAILIVLDEPQGTEETGGRAGAGLTAAPVAGAVASRIAPLLGVARERDLERNDAALIRYTASGEPS